jgi:Xaa-Pro aminopeptidase
LREIDRGEADRPVMEPVPREEISSRVAGLQTGLKDKGLALALIRQAADLFYYTGTLADGFLAVGPGGDPLFLARRPQERLLAGESPWPLTFYQDPKEIPAILIRRGFPGQGPVGLELDVLPAALYLTLKEEFFPGRALKDLSPLIRGQRMLKSPYELAQLRRAAALLDAAMAAVPALLRPGLTELELAAALEYRLRLLGHQGLIRTRAWNLELFYGHVLSGASGLAGAYTDTPSGGFGFSPAFPQGASLKKLAPGEPISVDLAACVNGYAVDSTRMFALKSLPPRAWEAWAAVVRIYRIFAAEARPGVAAGKLYQRLREEARAQGLKEFFMGRGADRVSFLGHGVGLELDEYPFLTARFPYPLQAEMVLAFEPKFFLPEIGMVGLEDTGRITPAGVEWLTRSPREIIIV